MDKRYIVRQVCWGNQYYWEVMDTINRAVHAPDESVAVFDNEQAAIFYAEQKEKSSTLGISASDIEKIRMLIELREILFGLAIIARSDPDGAWLIVAEKRREALDKDNWILADFWSGLEGEEPTEDLFREAAVKLSNQITELRRFISFMKHGNKNSQ